MGEGKKVDIQAAKGRPMLSWVGKQPLRQVTAFPAQHIETYSPNGSAPELKVELWKDWPDTYPQGGLLFHGDNKEVLAHLLANGLRGEIDLVYIDPPFDSGANYVRKVRLKGLERSTRLDGEEYSIGEQIQYQDIWANDNYMQFMYHRFQLLGELLNPESGAIAVHCDWRKSHQLRLLLDEVFGPNNFRGEVLVRSGTKNVQSQFSEVSTLSTGNNSILLYSKSTEHKLRKLQHILDEIQPGKWDTFWRGTDRPTMRYRLLDQTPSDGQWRWKKRRAENAVENYQAYLKEYSHKLSLDEYYILKLNEEDVDLDFVRKDEAGTIQYYVPPRKYKLLSNVWFDLPYRGVQTDYPTEKHEAPIKRLIQWLTDPGGLILDCFIGSGTSVAVAQKSGRRWIGCDINRGAIQTTSKRIEAILHEQVKQPELLDDGDNPPPAQYSFAVYRVNDYDLQIQHNEAVELACQHIGIQRTSSDAFFDGTYGKKLAKITPFNHPLSLLDLEEIKRELEARPEEDRDIVLVSLGKETTVDAWLEDWNKLRKKGDVPNKIEVIELRSDPKYGKFFVHEPASGKVKINRKDSKIHIEIENFVSPTIIERLKSHAGLLVPKLEDWRSMVDTVMIDPAYDGKVLNVALADVPEKKDDLVGGEYELDAPGDETTVAVKITDMLGEEVLVTQRV